MGSLISFVFEFLFEEEVVELIGCEYLSKQIEWLNRYGWKYVVIVVNCLIVGCVYVCLKLVGVKLMMEVIEKWSLDLFRVR